MVFLLLAWPTSESIFSGWRPTGLYTRATILLFTLYMAPLQDVIHSFSLDSMFYADETQSYIVIDDPKDC